MSHTQEPFGYFKAEPFGWTDCAETDEGAQPMWDNNAMCAIEKQRDDALTAKAQYQTLLADMTERCHDAEKQRDELLVALEKFASVVQSVEEVTFEDALHYAIPLDVFDDFESEVDAVIASVKGNARCG